MPMLIELKEVAGQERVRDVIVRHGAASTVPRGLGVPRRARPASVTGASWSGASRKDILRLLVGAATGTRPRRVAYHALSVPDRQHFIPVATRRFIADAHTLGCPVHIWTVDDPAQAASLRARGANGILTNDPARLAAFGRGTGKPG